MRRWLSVIAALVLVLLVVTPCIAENCLDKLGQGLIDGATGWCEYPKQIVETTKEDGIAVGLTWGQIKGVAYGLERSGLGAYNTGFFLVPPYDRPVLDPKYVF